MTPERKTWRLQFSLRALIIVMLIVGAGIGIGFYLHNSYYRAELRLANDSGRQLYVKVDWEYRDQVVAHQECTIETGGRRSFAYLPRNISEVPMLNYGLISLLYRLEGFEEEIQLLHVRMFQGEIRSFKILESGGSEYVSEEFRAPIMDRKR